MPVKEIQSDTLIPIEEHFRVSAGPGAGKTHWLSLHIQNVLQNSKRLGSSKKIACITYTNIAVETIIKRLNFVAERVEVSTIHSFLYNNIVKPYVSFIAAEYELEVKKMDGHDDHYVSKSKLKGWIKNHPNKKSLSHPYSENQLIRIPHNLEALANWLGSIKYIFNGDNLEISVDNSKAFYLDGGTRRNLGTTTCLNKLSPGLLEYKKIYWRNGILHHDDVLFFSYLLLKKYPFVASVIRTKFPYFFLDEFQDTSPVQAAIVNIIGESKTIIGVIGDKAQSIYSFQGATPKLFEDFNLPCLQDYAIAGNRRSTDSIINVLNHIRKEFKQSPVRQSKGVKPILYVGTPAAALLEASKLTERSTITMLSRDNITSNAMKREFNSAIPSVNLISEYLATDLDSDRRTVIISCLNAVELAKQKRFKEAIKEMEKNFRKTTSKQNLKKIAFSKLAILLSQYEKFKNQPFFNFFSILKSQIRTDISQLTRGASFEFCQKHTFEQLAVCINITEDNSQSRTIHKSKGDEFDNVLVLLKREADLHFLTKPNLNLEEQRVLYVAVSRSKEVLYLNVPELDAATLPYLQELFDVQRIA